MENLSQNGTLKLQVANFDPAQVYNGASSLKLTETERKNLAAPFENLEYEITPQGYMYLPQAVSLKRLNDVIGIGEWGLLLIGTGAQKIQGDTIKVFYDGALMIRNCFVSRATGEATYSEKNNGQSYASALEAAKSDCRQRCCKDMGIANDAWNPTFIRRWQKEHAIKVMVIKENKQMAIWRRKDLDPYPNEVGMAPDKPTVNPPKAPANELPWLNIPSTEYDTAIKELLEGKTITELKKEYRSSGNTFNILTETLKKEWNTRLQTCKTTVTLTESFTANEKEIKEYSWLHAMFHARKAEILNQKQPA